jgi:methylglutaconyl-CoA hydratase
VSDLLNEIQDSICLLTINRINKSNAFDDHLLTEMQQQFNAAIKNNKVRVIMLKANGKHFSAGADIAWMQRMAHFNIEENTNDAMVLANLMSTIHYCPKPTIAMIQGCAYGGGAGLAAACDIAIAGTSARFCFSEVKLGLIPAIISPYVIKAIGARAAKALFLSAEVFDATRALTLNLIQHCIADEDLLTFTIKHAQEISKYASESVSACKQLVDCVVHKEIDDKLTYYTASLIAHIRVSTEGQKGLKAFLNKK